MLTVEYITPDGLVQDRFEMADGMTLNQAACTICPDTSGKFPIPTIALVGSRPAIKKRGDWDFPLSGATIQFRQLAMGGGGGGSNPLQMVLQIAIIALAAAATWYIGGTGAGLFGIEALGLGMTWGGLAGAGIMMLGTMLMGALFQQKLPQGQMGAMGAEQASPTYSINASGNQARLYQPEPEGFGHMKFIPDFTANTWTEYIDNDQIGYFVYAVGRGHYDIESLQFGETVFWQNGALVTDTGYEILELEFIEPGNPVTIFPDNVTTSEEVNGQQLFAPNQEEFTGAIGPYITNAPGTVTNRLMFDFVFQQGVGHYNDQGGLENTTVNWKIDYRLVDDFGNALSDWSILDTPSITMSTLTPQRITKSYAVPEGRYQVRVIRTSDTDGDGRTLDTLLWGALRAMLPGTYTYPISCVAFSVRANNALTQSASRQFSIIATRKLPLYNRQTKTWSAEVPTRSWAAAVSHVCKCEWGGRLTDTDIDLDTLWAIDEKLQAKNWFYDSYIDGAYLVWTLLCEMCQSQCVIPRLVGPVLSFVQDAPDRPPVFALTPRNIVRGTFSVNYVTWSDSTPDDVTVEYLDADYGFQQRDVTAILPESESQEPSSLDILGITNRSHAHKVAVAYAAHNRWQRIKVECQVEAMGRLINQGDICTVSHPRFKNTESGVVENWNESSLSIGIKRDINGKFESDNFYISLVRPDGSIWGPCKIASINDNSITLDQADYSTLLLQGQGNPFEWLTPGYNCQPTSWVLYTAKEYQRLMVVDSVQAQDALHYSLQLLNYDDRIYGYENLPVPIWQGRGQLPDDTILRQPEYLRGVIELDTAVQICWLPVSGATWYEVHISSDAYIWKNLGRINDTQTLVIVEPGPIYVRVRAGNDNRMSTWATWQGDTLNPVPDIPEPVLIGTYSGGNANISWPEIANSSSYLITLRNSSDTAVYTATQTGTSFQITPEIQRGGPYRDLTVCVSARNQTGSSGVGKLNLSDPIPPAPTNIVISHPEKNYFSLDSVQTAKTGTGYVIVVSNFPDFSFSEMLHYYTAQTLPHIFSFAYSGFCKVAVKDAFYDIAPDPTKLNWSEPVELANV